MNEIVDKFLLVRDKLMPEMHLWQSGFTYSVCEPFAKNRKDTKILRSRRFSIHLSKRTR